MSGTVPEALECDLVVVHAQLITMNDQLEVITDGAIAVKDGRIAAVGPTPDIHAGWKSSHVIDADGGMVHPGYIDGHCHAGLHLIRGLLDDDPESPPQPGQHAFVRWLNTITPDDEYVSTQASAVEALMNGFTGFVEAGTAYDTDRVAAAVNSVGIRCSLGEPFLWDRPGIEHMAEEIERAPCSTDRCLKGLGSELWRNKDAGSRVRGHVALYGLGSSSDELMRAAKDLSDSNNVPLHQHQSLSPEDYRLEREQRGRAPLLYLAEQGLIGPNNVYTHMNILNAAERDAVVESGMAVVWQPGNAAYYRILREHSSPFPELERRGVDIAFGIDVGKIWAFGDLGYVAYLTMRSEGDYVSPWSIVRMFTRGGARAFGLPNELGQIAPGYRADIVVRAPCEPANFPGLSPENHLALSARTQGVRTVICDGEVLLKDRVPTRIDLDELAHTARATARDVAGRAGIPIPHRARGAGGVS